MKEPGAPRRVRLGAFRFGCRNGLFWAVLAAASECLRTLGRNGLPGRFVKCRCRRSSSHNAAARTCRIASPLTPSFQNFSVPFTRRFSSFTNDSISGR